jgi:hypothetical protein
MRVDTWADRALALLSVEVREHFAADPIDCMTSELGLHVVPAEHLTDSRTAGGACDGVSFLEDDVVLYAPSFSRRQNFTLAHETGHWLLEHTAGFLDWVADQETPAAAVETICDRIAQRLLLSKSQVAAIVGAGPVRAQHVMELYNSSAASRRVCAIGLAQSLPGLGAVVIADRETGIVELSSVHPDPEKGWPTVYPWNGQTLPPGNAFRRIGTGVSATKLMRWQSPWGTNADFYVDGITDDRRLYLVFSQTDLWGTTASFVATEVEFAVQPERQIFCCGKTRVSRGFPCPKCGQPFCPNCRECSCDKRAAREDECNECHSRVLPHLLQDGLCEICA